MAIADENFFGSVIAIIADVTGIPKEELLPEKSLTEDLGIDSLTKIDLAVTIQDDLKIDVEDDKLKELKTVQDVVDLVRSARLATAS